MTAFLRDINKMPVDLQNKINIKVGDVLDADAVANACEGHDVVLSSLGRGWSLSECKQINF